MTSLAGRKHLVILIAVVALAGGVIAAGAFAYSRLDVRGRVVRAIEERFQSDVELGSLEVSLLPPLRVTANSLVVRHHGRRDVPPFITIRRFSFDAGLLGILRRPYRVRFARLEGLEIHIPPDNDDDGEKKPRKPAHYPFLIQRLDVDQAMLRILPRKAGKEPLEWDIRDLVMQSVGTDRPMSFRARIGNPRPPGDITASGEFGPWRNEDPGMTHVAGQYSFRNADLSDFKGIAGTLSSDGRFGGVLGRLDVHGTTDTPDFRVRGNPVHLKTEFDAVVDGTDGDTLLQPVRAQFLRSIIIARGGVEGRPGRKGKTIALDVTVEQSQIEDLLRLAARGEPPLKGAVRFHTRFLLPPGKSDVMERLELNGRFGIESARFTKPGARRKLGELSQRAQGRPPRDGAAPEEDVASDFAGTFVMKGAVIRFSRLSFRVPGAWLQLNGSYDLKSEQLDFRGTLRLEAKLSQTTTGVKSLLLKALDPFFKRGTAGAVLPIRITGTPEQPKYGLAF